MADFESIGHPRHNCFETELPTLPIGYMLNLDQPRRAIPLPGFANLPVIEACDRCWVRATTMFNVDDINRNSAWHSLTDEELFAMAAYFAGNRFVNVATHPLFDVIFPLYEREGRTIVNVIRHYIVRGRIPKLNYLIEYTKASEDFRTFTTYVTQTEMLCYEDGLDIITDYWYGPRPHRIDSNFVRLLLRVQGPMANSAVWAHLPYDEATCIAHLYAIGRLDQWMAGLTLPLWRASVDAA